MTRCVAPTTRLTAITDSQHRMRMSSSKPDRAQPNRMHDLILPHCLFSISHNSFAMQEREQLVTDMTCNSMRVARTMRDCHWQWSSA